MAVVDDATIAKLHEEFLDDPEPTDVLSFLLERSPAGPGRRGGRQRRHGPGHRPRGIGCTAEDELLRYVIHGTLHLVGYDDTTPRSEPSCENKRRKYLCK